MAYSWVAFLPDFPPPDLRFPSAPSPHSDAEMNMLDQLQTWWQQVPPDVQAVLPTVGVVLGALLGGYVLGKIMAGVLHARNFDAVLRLPGASPDPDADHGFTPTRVAGLLVQLTVWAGAAWWLARQH